MKSKNLFNYLLDLKMIVLLLVICLSSSVLAQENISLKIDWLSPILVESENGTEKIPSISGQTLQGEIPHFGKTKAIKGNSINNAELISIEKSAATKDDIEYLNNHFIEVGELKYDLNVTYARDKKVMTFNLFPFIMVNGKIHRVTGVEIQLNSFGVQQITNKDFVANSVLGPGSGFWYKVSVTQDGVYKIDYDFLNECLAGSGIDINTINPNSINIFGNGEGKLPESNSKYRTDDLAKNAIEIVGDGDGSFDQGDYIQFFARGPHRWTYSALDTFERVQNIYSDESIYFININSSDTPLRIATQNNSSGTVNEIVNSYNYRYVHESDLVNLVSGGQRWYGELFDGADLTRVFNFTIPNVDPSAYAQFDISIATNARTNGNTHTYSVNNVQEFTKNLQPTGSDYRRISVSMDSLAASSAMSLKAEVSRISPDVIMYMDRIKLTARANLIYAGGQLGFRDINSIGVGNVGEFTVSNVSSSNIIWEITDKHIPSKMNGSLSGNQYSFIIDTDSLREFVTFTSSTLLVPSKVGQVDHQNLHGLEQAELVIVSPNIFMAQANRLADLHRSFDGINVHVVTPQAIYNEFSSGMPDATAIKYFAKMFYDRGAIDPTNRIENLLLFGDGTFDPKNRVENNNNFVLAYEMASSEDHIFASVADDYYGMLDFTEGNQSGDKLDIGVGRLLISDTDMAKDQVDKIEHYMKSGSNLYQSSGITCDEDGMSSTYGDWRNRFVQIADDEELIFINANSEQNYNYLKDSFPEINVRKIYLDAFPQITTAGGERYPEAKAKINEEIDRGCLVMIYVGHGGEVGVAEERVITVPQIQEWDNINNMPLIVSATCEFTKYDDPSRVSAGEWASINPLGGAIALMTTTRSIFYGTNSNITDAFYRHVYELSPDGKALTFGEIIARTKNDVSGTNQRSFALIGDPALRIALPEHVVVTDSVNGFDPEIVVDTLKALSKVTIKGHLEDQFGNVLSSYNGVVYPTIFDKPKTQETLQNDAISPFFEFELQTSKVYKGKASVVNGYFEFTFVVPKDIVYSIDFGKISYYSENGNTDALGSDNRVYVGGINPDGLDDDEGPDMELFMNDESFVNGGTTNESPMLIVKLFDENGINATGSGIGHDLVGILDNESGSPIVLNDFYEANLDSYQSGEIRYNFSEIEPGEHTLTVKVWDVNNNSSEGTIEFFVQEQEEIKLDHVLNYPNPFTTSTEFYFEHNQVCTNLDVQIQIFTVAGRLVKTINQDVHTDGFRSNGIPWNGLDDFGDQLAKGVYIYRLKVRTPDGGLAEETEKLVLLR